MTYTKKQEPETAETLLREVNELVAQPCFAYKNGCWCIGCRIQKFLDQKK